MTMQRASTTGLVISGFGLSAFFFSSIAHLFFPGDTSSFFLILALGTSIPMIIGFFFVRTIPLPSQEGYDIVENDMPDEEAVTTALLPRSSTENHLLDHDLVEPRHPHYVHHVHDTTRQDCETNTTTTTTLSEDIPIQDLEAPVESRHLSNLSRRTTSQPETLSNIYGKKLFQSADFWLLCSILSTRELH